MDAGSKDYEFEMMERYYGGEPEVRKVIEDCPCCGSKFVITHSPDAGSLIVEETSRCLDCDFGQRKVIHILN
tara:strand:- start:180 stop:395 length:216 start_codon:yes stop_codon:yes gene_type:complete